MNERCKGCNILKGTFKCKLITIVNKYSDANIECPCFECLVKAICQEQCIERIRYFKENIDRLEEEYNIEDTL